MSEIRCKGVNGTVIFDGTWVTIDRGRGLGIRPTLGKGSEKRIALTQISSVRWQAPTRMNHGFVSFSLPGSTTTRDPWRFGSMAPSQTP